MPILAGAGDRSGTDRKQPRTDPVPGWGKGGGNAGAGRRGTRGGPGRRAPASRISPVRVSCRDRTSRPPSGCRRPGRTGVVQRCGSPCRGGRRVAADASGAPAVTWPWSGRTSCSSRPTARPGRGGIRHRRWWTTASGGIGHRRAACREAERTGLPGAGVAGEPGAPERVPADVWWAVAGLVTGAGGGLLVAPGGRRASGRPWGGTARCRAAPGRPAASGADRPVTGVSRGRPRGTAGSRPPGRSPAERSPGRPSRPGRGRPWRGRPTSSYPARWW